MDREDLAASAETCQGEFSKALVIVRQEKDIDGVENLRVQYLGRKGKITHLLDCLKKTDKAQRPVYGKAINLLKQHCEREIEGLKELAKSWFVEQELAKPPIDITLPVTSLAEPGSAHPVTLMRQQLLSVFHNLGFTIYDGPEVDFDFFNFTALNMPDHHPARDMQDTFYIKGKGDLVLRTHTSNIQVHCMQTERPPLRIVAPGRVFRCDSDPTHTPMFHQIEGFVVDREISFAHMKGTIDTFLKGVFGSKFKTRFRPSYFPFVEPGAEVDLMCVLCQGSGCRICKNTGWLEIGGCGMIHPNVFENVEYDSEHYTGFAFGFGMDRMAMLKYKLNDLRQLFDGSLAFLSRFPTQC
jgi:phenylalanyl-tRNA synthetase alpha chain